MNSWDRYVKHRKTSHWNYSLDPFRRCVCFNCGNLLANHRANDGGCALGSTVGPFFEDEPREAALQALIAEDGEL